MIHATPPLDDEIAVRLGELDRLRARLDAQTRAPARWLGSLRRLIRARAADSSVSIEGYHVPPDHARAIMAGTELVHDERASTSELALICYGRAMDHVAALAADPLFRWSDRVLKDLHFEVCYFQADKLPGRWRSGPVYVRSGPAVLYEGPSADDVPDLMDEVVAWLQHGDLDSHVVVRAAMAHLHVVSVHPFRDGNGRLSRITQSLVLALDKMLAPEFTSIEEYLGEHTEEYYAALDKAHGPIYDPHRSARDWVLFCLDAHLDQARARLREIDEAAERWNRLSALVDSLGWNERFVIALDQALTDRVTNASYRAEAGISDALARKDFQRMADTGLLAQRGKSRDRHYVAADTLRQLVTAGTGSSTRITVSRTIALPGSSPRTGAATYRETIRSRGEAPTAGQEQDSGEAR